MKKPTVVQRRVPKYSASEIFKERRTRGIRRIY